MAAGWADEAAWNEEMARVSLYAWFSLDFLSQ
jgi:hypothetical protein